MVPCMGVTCSSASTCGHGTGPSTHQVQSTTQDLEDHLNDISDRLKYLDVTSPSSNEATDLDLQRIQNEINSTEQCLQICANVLVHINSMRLRPFPELVQGDTQFSAEQFPRSYAITFNTLQGCSEMLNDTVSKLHEHQKMTQDLPSRDEFYRLSTTPADEVQRLRGELDSTRKRLAVCQEASDRASTDRIHMVEDITMGHDGQQLFVSTLGDLFNILQQAQLGRRRAPDLIMAARGSDSATFLASRQPMSLYWLTASFCDSPSDNKRFIGCDYVSRSEGRVWCQGDESHSAAEIIEVLITEPEDRAFEILRLVRKGGGPTDILRRVKRQQKHQRAMESRSCNEAQTPPARKSK
ncbi:hypothetical protein PG995_005191 [Apiospora arundinis]